MSGILVIDGDRPRNGSLETILRFLGYEYESGEEGDCLALLDTLSSLFAVVLGNFSGKSDELLAKYPNTPFILIEDEGHPKMPADGRVRRPSGSYSPATQGQVLRPKVPRC